MNMFTRVINLNDYQEEAEETKVQNRLEELYGLAETLRAEAQYYDSSVLLAMVVEFSELQKITHEFRNACTAYQVKYQKYKDKDAEYTKDSHCMTSEQRQTLESIRLEMNKHFKDIDKWGEETYIRHTAITEYMKDIFGYR